MQCADPDAHVDHRHVVNLVAYGGQIMYHMRLDPSVHPTMCAPRQPPLAMKDKIIKELDRMTKLGVIKPVQEPTEH